MPIVIACSNCGQKNRMPTADVPLGKKVVCGRCAHRLDVPAEAPVDDDADDVDDDDLTCATCDGSGEVSLDDDSDDPMDCPACDGSGLKAGA